MIDEEFYHIDPYCSIIVNELGMTSCGSSSSTEALLPDPQKAFLGLSVIELASVSGGGAMLVLVTILVTSLVACCISKRKSKSYNVR
jgi:hypothetical protein